MKNIKKLFMLLFITSFLIGIIFIPNVNASSDNLRYDFKKNILDTSNKENVNLKHNNIITGNYNASYSFENDTINQYPSGFIINDDGGSLKVISELDKHNKVLEMYDNNSVQYVSIIKNFLTSVNFGSFEYFVQLNDTTKGLELILENGENVLFGLLIDSDKFQYYDGSWNDVELVALDNTWYHIRIDFECTNGNYKSLSQYNWQIFINNIHYGNYNFANNEIESTTLQFKSGISALNYYLYIDSLGLTWLDNYTLGLNKYPIIELVDSNTLSSDKYEFNLDVNNNPYYSIGNPSLLDWETVYFNPARILINVPTYPRTFIKSKNINGINTNGEVDGIGIKNDTLGIYGDKINISFGFQPLVITEIDSYFNVSINSLNNTKIIELKFDTIKISEYGIITLQYYNGNNFINLFNITNIMTYSYNIYEFNIYIENFNVDLRYYINDTYINTYYFPLLSNLTGINKLSFLFYDEHIYNSDYYMNKLTYIGIYQFDISLCRELGYIKYDLQNDWNFNKYNLFEVISNQYIKIIVHSFLSSSYFKFRNFDNNTFFWNLQDKENIIENPYLYLIIQSNINFNEYLFVSIEGIKLDKYINSVFDTEKQIKYYFHNILNKNLSYYYVDNSNRLHYQMDITQNDTLEYMIIYFDFVSGIPSNNKSIHFKCRELSLSVGYPYIAMTYYQPPDNHFDLKTYLTIINILLYEGKEFRRFHFVITDENNNYCTGLTSEGYLYELQFNYVPLGIPIPIVDDFITLSLIAIMIPLIILIVPTISIYGVYRKKEIIIPLLLLMSIICFVSNLIPLELFFVMILCFGSFIFLQYKRGFNQE